MTVIEDWFGEEEQRQVENFLALKSLLETNFGYWQVFRVGEVEIDLYLLTKINAEEWGD
ncbi:MAG: nuclease A inhibitor family protein [Spirosomataceae bacterium]